MRTDERNTYLVSVTLGDTCAFGSAVLWVCGNGVLRRRGITDLLGERYLNWHFFRGMVIQVVSERHGEAGVVRNQD